MHFDSFHLSAQKKLCNAIPPFNPCTSINYSFYTYIDLKLSECFKLFLPIYSNKIDRFMVWSKRNLFYSSSKDFWEREREMFAKSKNPFRMENNFYSYIKHRFFIHILSLWQVDDCENVPAKEWKTLKLLKPFGCLHVELRYHVPMITCNDV